MRGYRPSILNFPRAETFSAMAKFNGKQFSLSETMVFTPELCKGNFQPFSWPDLFMRNILN